MLYKWSPVVTALLPNIVAMLMALSAVLVMENRNAIAQRNIRLLPWRKSAI
jgi:lipopolysaccharide export system permease protein